MNYALIAVSALIVMAGVGIAFGLVLAFSDKKLAMETNPLIHIVEDSLPKGQCGACGYAGCQAYAEAVVLNPDVPPNLCIPGKEAVAKVVAELTNKVAAQVDPIIARLNCNGTKNNASLKGEYSGVHDCLAAFLLHGGPKSCDYGCIGFGTCVKNCPFDAMTLSEEGLPIIDQETCTGCGKCASVCPKKVIDLVPLSKQKVVVKCSSCDKGAVSRKLCSVACIGCGICSKSCPYGAIKMTNNLAVVDSSICMEQCSEIVCTNKCPTGAIKKII